MGEGGFLGQGRVGLSSDAAPHQRFPQMKTEHVVGNGRGRGIKMMRMRQRANRRWRQTDGGGNLR